MKCERCHIEIRGDASYCPLCQNDLCGKNRSANIFPRIPLILHQNMLFLRIMGFVSVSAALICLLINGALPGKGWWSLFVLGGLASVWLSVFFIIMKRGNIHKTITWQVALLSIISIAWDMATGFHHWSIDFVLPILGTSALLGMTIIARVLRLQITDYMIYLLIDAVIGVVSMILLFRGALISIWPSIICIATSLLFFAALCIFEGKSMLGEFQRRMHI